MRLQIKVVPRASRSALVGWMGAVLKVRLAAAPERGAANQALVELLAAVLGIPPDQVRLVAGRGSERKVVEIDGLTQEQLRRRVGGALAGHP